MVLYFSLGLVLLLGGLQIMRSGLEGAAHSRMRLVLAAFTASPLRSLVTGTVITALVQSSTAITVLTIGFVNAGILSLARAIGIILGANIGTCVTAQLLSFNLSALALPAAAAGLLCRLAGRKRASLKYAGQSLFGFGMIFLGLDMISGSFVPLRHSPWFTEVLSSLDGHPLLAALAGAVFTGLIHSSATTTGVVMALSRQGLLDLPSSIAVVLGGNIGTCVTAVLASTGGTAAGKRVAMAHVLLNLGGVAAFLPALHPFTSLVRLTDPSLPRQIANAQTIFNVAGSLAAFPFIRGFARLLTVLIREF
jgi:phosphate:Na+ symporter